MTNQRKEPRWTVLFLRALERTGKVCVAAEDAGVDRTTAFVRRRGHGDFAAAWAAALERFEEAKKRAEEEEIAAVRASPLTRLTGGKSPAAGSHRPPDGALPGAPTQGRGGEELTVSGGQVRRVSSERWGKRKEAIFFDELAATNNIHRSAAAAGVSYNAVLARRHKHPLFAAKWEAVERNARATIGMHLLEETQKSFDPAAMNLPESAPRVTIDQAIRISQIGAAKDKAERDPFAEEAAAMGEEERPIFEERVLRKLERLGERREAERIEQGWQRDEAHGSLVPPGWRRDDCEGQEEAKPQRD